VQHWMEWLGLPTDPVKAIRVPRKPLMKSRALEVVDTTRLRDTALMVGGRQGMVVLCGLYLAARAGEIGALQWEGYRDGWFEFKRTKTRDTIRLPVHPILVGALDEYRSLGVHSLYLFPGNHGAPHITPATVWTWVKYVGALAEVEVTPHRLRHTALTAALAATKDLRAVMDLAGHRDPTVTAQYTRLSDKRLTDAVLGLDY